MTDQEKNDKRLAIIKKYPNFFNNGQGRRWKLYVLMFYQKRL